MEQTHPSTGPRPWHAWVVPAVVVASGVALLVAACARVMPGEPIERPVAEVVDAVPDCTTSAGAVPTAPDVPADDAPTRPEPPRAGSVPSGFVPVTVVECGIPSLTSLTLPDGLWSSVTETTREGDLVRLLTALSEPNGGRAPVCTADFEFVPDLWLVDASGSSMRAARPVDGCGKTTGDTGPAVADLPVVGEREVPVQRIESREALDAGCRTSTSAPVFFDASGWGLSGLPPDASFDPGATALPAAPAAPPRTTVDPASLDRACLYRVVAPADVAAPPGSTGDADGGLMPVALDTPATFVRVVPLDAEEARALVEAIDGPVLDGDCGDRPSWVATIPRSGPGTWPVDDALTLELDGCQRLTATGGQAYALPPGLAEALLVR